MCNQLPFKVVLKLSMGTLSHSLGLRRLINDDSAIFTRDKI